MRLRIDAENQAEHRRARRIVRFVLSGVSNRIDDARVSIERVCGPAGTFLTHCDAEISLHQGEQFRVEETQSSLDLAVSLALKRSKRLLERKLTRQGFYSHIS